MRRSRSRVAIFATVGLIALVAGAPAGVAEPTATLSQSRQNADVPEAGEFLVSLANKAITGLTDKSLPAPERAARFRALLTDGFDVPGIARFVLGRYWRLATEMEREEYLRLFEDFIVQSYAQRFTDYAGENLKVAASRNADNEIAVFTDLIRPSGPPVKVEWRMRREAPNFKIVDVVVEGVSMGITQRDDFSAAIQRNGGKIEGLLTILRDKVRTAKAT